MVCLAPRVRAAHSWPVCRAHLVTQSARRAAPTRARSPSAAARARPPRAASRGRQSRGRRPGCRSRPRRGRREGRGRIPCDLLRARRQRLRWDAHRDRSVRQAAHPRIGLGGRRHRLEGLAAAEAPFEGLVLEGLGGRRVGRAAAVAAAGAHGLGGLAIGGPTPCCACAAPSRSAPAWPLRLPVNSNRASIICVGVLSVFFGEELPPPAFARCRRF